MSEFLTTKDLLYRFQVSHMTLWRWERDLDVNFPKAMYVGKTKRWRRADIEAWEMRRYGSTSALESVPA